jgi:hypothetical protein
MNFYSRTIQGNSIQGNSSYLRGLLLNIMLFIVVAYSSQSVALPISTNYYGTGLALNSLANYPIGTNYRREVSIRFKSENSGRLTSIQPFWIYKNSRGYHQGSGGSIRITLRPDDGTWRHLPSSRSLGSFVFYPNLPRSRPTSKDIRFKPISFPGAPYLEKGKIYHLHFQNVDRSPSSNWISLNSLYHYSRDPATYLPTVPTSDWALLSRIGGRQWNVTTGYVPILAMHLSTNGNTRSSNIQQGQGYMEYWGASGNGTRVGGNNRVRQGIRPVRRMKINSVNINLGRYRGSGSLAVQLVDSSGNQISQSYIPAGSMPLTSSSRSCPGRRTGERCHVWARANFGDKPTLYPNQTYYLVLSAPYGSDYRFNLARNGSVMYGYPRASVFSGGYAQVSSNRGRSWQGVRYWGRSNRIEGDLEFYFEVS